MKNEKTEALFIAGMYYIALACIFAILSVIFRNTFTLSMIVANTTLTLCALLLCELYKRFDNVHWIINLSSMVVLVPILIVLMIIDVIWNIGMFIYYLIRGGGEND